MHKPPQPPKAMTQLPSANRVITAPVHPLEAERAAFQKHYSSERRIRNVTRNTLGVNNAPNVDRILD